MKKLKFMVAAALLGMPLASQAQNPGVSGVLIMPGPTPFYADSFYEIGFDIFNSGTFPIPGSSGCQWVINLSGNVELPGTYRFVEDLSFMDWMDIEFIPKDTEDSTKGWMIACNLKPEASFPNNSYHSIIFDFKMREPGIMGTTIQVMYSGPIPTNLPGDDNQGVSFTFLENPLGVNWLHFNAKAVNNKTLLSWATAKEENCKGYEIERSIDGLVWEKIGYTPTLSKDGNSTTELSYTALDTKPVQGKNLYRIKQIDQNGKSELTKVVEVYHENAGFVMNIYPNPTNGLVTIEGISGPSKVEIFDALGRKVFNEKRQNFNEQVSLNSFPAGNYILNVTSESGVVNSFKIVKN